MSKKITPAKLLGFFVLFLLTTLACAWLSGALFYGLRKVNPISYVNLLTWWEYYQAYQGDPIIKKHLLRALGLAAGISYSGFALAVYFALREPVALHGRARFATEAEINRSGLLDNDGIVIGKYRGKYLTLPGSLFCLLAAPTRTGKGVGMVVPNLLSYPHSVIVLDIKAENFLITSKYRAYCGQAVYLFNPFDETGKTHQYNPLGYVSENPKLRIGDILSIAAILWPGHGKDRFFDDAAQNLFLGICLLVLETPSLPKTLGECLRQGSGTDKPTKAYLSGLIRQRNYREVERIDETSGEIIVELVPVVEWDGLGDPPLSHECVESLNRFLSTSENTLTSILATFNAPLTLFASPLVDAATSANSFDFREVRKRPMSIYLAIPPNKLESAELLINLFLSQAIALNTDQLMNSSPELGTPCLLLMDEFTAPGRIGIIAKSNAFLAGYGLRLLTIIQSPSQLKESPRLGYGPEGAETLMTNHAAKVLFTPADQRTAQDYSDLLGTYTFKSRSVNIHERSKGSESDQRRALLLPQELRELPDDKQIISFGGNKPILCDKIFYYKEHLFMDRLKQVSHRLRALDTNRLTKQLPSQAQFETLWFSGELAADVPTLDVDLHIAKVRKQTRPATLSDVSPGIDLSRLDVDFSKLSVPDSDPLAPEDVQSFVSDFFAALEGGSPSAT